jgi:hypothetical protein
MQQAVTSRLILQHLEDDIYCVQAPNYCQKLTKSTHALHATVQLCLPQYKASQADTRCHLTPLQMILTSPAHAPKQYAELRDAPQQK